jgi:hypothetical protein
MIRPVSVRALPNYRIHIRFSDGAEGDVDLSEFTGKEVFSTWRDPNFLSGSTSGSIGRSGGTMISNFARTQSICG